MSGGPIVPWEQPVGSPVTARLKPAWEDHNGAEPGPLMADDYRLLVDLVHPKARIPTRGHDGDAGYDLFVSETTLIKGGEFTDVPCGIRVQLPVGYWGRITGRSSTLRKRGLLVNEAVIDNGYVGLIFTGVFNLGQADRTVHAGDRLAQLILHPISVVPVHWATPDRLASRDGRGDSGFGSTGN